MKKRPGKSQLEGMDRPPTRDELPTSLWPGKIIRIEDRPDLVTKFTEKPYQVLPMPEGLTPRQIQRLSNLAQYKGRTPEGHRRSVMNIQLHERHCTMPDQTTPPPVNTEIVQPEIPTAMPDVARAQLFRGQALRTTMSTMEWDLYSITWNEIKTAHIAEYITPEDDMDVHRLCMETVIQFRIEQEMQRSPSKVAALNSVYTSSSNRMQKARENLASRRRDRLVLDQKNPHSQTNIAILVGGSDMDQFIEQRKQQALENDNAMSKFLESTVVTAKDAETAK